MEFSTEVVKKLAEIVVTELERLEVGASGIREVELQMRELLQAVGGVALGRFLERQDEPAEATGASQCGCGGQIQYQFRRKAVILSVFGRVHYTRRYYTCPNCHQGQSPLDRRMGIEAGAVTAGLAELLALMGVEVAFEEATRLVERFLLVSVSDNTLRQETERFGQLQAAEEAEWKQQSHTESWLQERQHQIAPQSGRLYGSLDGVMAPLKGEWRELKNIAWYRVERVHSYQARRHHASAVGEQKDLQATEISYHCDMQSPEPFGELFWASACQRQADRYAEVVFVCDGAVWIWKLVERYFPQAVQIVDWYHASAYLAPIAEAAFGRETPAYQDWLDQARSQLWAGQVDELIQECLLLAGRPAAAAVVQEALTYFRNNRKRMDYARFRAQGYFIGSGTVESGGKQIASLRLKRAGARWTQPGAVWTAKARAAWLSHRWDVLAERRAALPVAA